LISALFLSSTYDRIWCLLTLELWYHHSILCDHASESALAIATA